MTCSRCGKCCYIYYQGKKHKCPYLKTTKGILTHCRVYSTRIGRIIHQNGPFVWLCQRRKEQQFAIPECTETE